MRRSMSSTCAFFKGDVTEYAAENGITDVLVLYGTQNFVKDTNISFLQ